MSFSQRVLFPVQGPPGVNEGCFRLLEVGSRRDESCPSLLHLRIEGRGVDTGDYLVFPYHRLKSTKISLIVPETWVPTSTVVTALTVPDAVTVEVISPRLIFSA